MKRVSIIFTIVVTLLMVSLIGFSQNAKTTLIQEYEKNVENLSVENNVTYIDSVNNNDVALGQNYAGDYIYEDTQYLYLVDPNEGYVEAIFPQIEEDNTAVVMSNAGNVSSNTFDTEIEILDYFSQNFDDDIKGILEVMLYSRLDGTKTYEVIEKVNGLETGTKGSISLDESNVLISAAFLKGDYDAIANLDIADLITETTARNYVLLELNSYDNITSATLLENSYQAELKTFNGTIYWNLCFNATIIMSSGEQVEQFFEAQINALTGDIINIAKAV